ncbi:hypothetical protein ACFQHO_43410 [Actinomadura yumaensis]|uniref:hypothetical protein n=1 Tax=Actinomadura TaxID=1988 RepID=UPI0015830BE5|nr:hypothetical protein [Actinomadura sp. J1-007]
MTETLADLVACEDVLMFVNAAITGSGSSTTARTASGSRSASCTRTCWRTTAACTRRRLR